MPVRLKASVARSLRVNADALIFIGPALFFYVAFTILPLIETVRLSFHQWNGADPVKKFIGLENYLEMFRDPLTLLSFYHTGIWIALSFIIQISVALFLAVLIAQIKRGQTAFRVILFLPKVLSVAVVAVIWGRIYDPYIGIINVLLRVVGLESVARGWLGDPVWVLPAIQIAHSWNGYGWYMVLYLAALQSVEPVFYEAATIEGASGIQKFRYITLPSIRHVHTLVLILSIIASLQAFGTVWAMTQGGPYNRSEIIATHIYKTAFSGDKVGYGAAMSLVLGVIIIGITIVTMKIRERND